MQVSVSVYKKLIGNVHLRHLDPVQCTMKVYTESQIQNISNTVVYVKYPGKAPQQLLFNVTDQEGSVLFCCEDTLNLDLTTPHDDLEDMEEGSNLVASSSDQAGVNNTKSGTPQEVVHKERKT